MNERADKAEEKVFCIGFHKTGTTSLAEALRTLGYRVTGPNGAHDPQIRNNVLRLVDELVPLYDAFQDNPWPIVYLELDKRYPGSKFILTVRDPESWIESQVGYFGDRSTPMREWIYGAGCPSGNEDIYLRRYLAHNEEVLEYFRDRPQDMICLDIPAGDGWEKLCAFLGKEIPDRPFPHRNRKSDLDPTPPGR
ncbi:sulfotransferase family protein [Thioalkalivibrio sp. HK1]|uniref:sulfotransferase family protein n=1 Tax=Thioalkalivibrio sp. HK1 TaxID=1469245 RepID=UPI00047176C2|nr:sulfotransferase family protein [Thioalkalivibrio sp. HK1]